MHLFRTSFTFRTSLSRPVLNRTVAIALGLTALVAAVSPSASAGPYQIHPQPLPANASRGLLNFGTPLLSGPSLAAHRMRRVPKDLSVAVYGSRDGFTEIQLRNGTQGWVVQSAVRQAAPLRRHQF